MATRTDDSQGARLRRSSGEPTGRLWQARLSLLWERLWLALWAPTSMVAAFLALALTNVLPSLPAWLHSLILLGFAAALAVAAWRGLRGFRPPDVLDVRRRLERDSGLPHRPLQALQDRVAGGDEVAAALWSLHQERVRAAMRRLRVRLPHPEVSARDRFALRALAGLLLFVTAAASHGEWLARTASALSPRFSGAGAAVSAALDLWVTPPEYTGLPPIFLQSAGAPAAVPADPIPVPKGSMVLARVTGGNGTPHLLVNDGSVTFESADEVSFHAQVPITGGRQIAVRQAGDTLGSWPVAVVEDRPPIIAHLSLPEGAERGALRLEYAAHDDYGLAGVNGTIRLAADPVEGEDGAIDGGPIELPLGLPGVRPREAQNASIHDLTAHPWAGLPVIVRLTATDGAGQTGTSDDAPITLPERAFNHPVARAIIEQRKKLTLRPTGARTEVARELSDISARPGTYHDDIIAFLALRTAIARLFLDESRESVSAIQALLWETALRIEDGGLSIAERDLRDAERRLSEALERDASDEELARLMDELQRALDEFLNAMEEQMRQAIERGDPIPQIPPELAQRMDTVDRDDLQRMMDQMRAMAETGARDAARQMLSQLQQMLENLRNGATAQNQQSQQQNEAMDLMRQLQDLAQRQQKLLDETFRQSQEQMNPMGNQPQTPGQQSPRGRQGQRGQPPGQGNAMSREQAEQQEALRRELGEVMRRMGDLMGDIPQPLGRAERAMRDAAEALRRGQPNAAVPPQTQAMDELQQGLQGMAQQMMQQMMGMMGPGMMPGTPPGQPDPRAVGRNRDPLGRRPPGVGQVDSEGVKVPEEADVQRAREILDELRRRAGDYNRPKPEREYIDRLLKQF